MNSNDHYTVIITLGSRAHITMCAEMMSHTDPWQKYGYSTNECADKLSMDNTTLLIAEKEKTLVGFALIRPKGFGSSHTMDLLCVAPAHRHHGVASALIKRVEDEVFSKEKNLFIFVSDFNTHAISLYKKHGYVQIGSLCNYNFADQTEYILRKSLGPRRG